MLRAESLDAKRPSWRAGHPLPANSFAIAAHRLAQAIIGKRPMKHACRIAVACEMFAN